MTDLLERMICMLEQKDVELLKTMMGEVMQENLKPLKDDVQDLKKMDQLILDEIVRVHEGVEAHISQLEKNMNEMKQFYRMDKLRRKHHGSEDSLLTSQLLYPNMVY